MWHQQPQTIKGVKVLPFLNCSRVHKMGTKTPALPSPSQKRRDKQKERELRLSPPPLTVTKRPLSVASTECKGFWAKRATELTKLTHEPVFQNHLLNDVTAFLQHMDLSFDITHYKPRMTLYFYSTRKFATYGMKNRAKCHMTLLANVWTYGWTAFWQGGVWWIGLFSFYVRLEHSMEKGEVSFTPHRVFFQGPAIAPVSLAISCAFLF